MNGTKRLRIIVGPNGSGKSSLYETLKAKVCLYDFINADELKLSVEKELCYTCPFKLAANELPQYITNTTFDDSVKLLFGNGMIKTQGKNIIFAPEAITSYSIAAFADFLRNAYLKHGRSCTVETVFSHPSKIDFLQKACNSGFKIYLYFVATENPELNVARVAQRVSLGGHDVPEDKIVSRYYRCLEQFYSALNFAYRAYFWDNSTREMRFFAEYKPDHSLETVGDLPQWFQKYIIEKI